MFEPLLGFTNTNCTGQTDRHFLHENPQFLSAKGTTKKAEALELFVYPNYVELPLELCTLLQLLLASILLSKHKSGLFSIFLKTLYQFVCKIQ